MKRPRVILADDHTMLLDAFSKLLEPSCEIVGRFADGRTLLEQAPRLRPDVVVLDISMPRLNGLDAGRQLKRLLPKAKIIFLTVNEDPDVAAECMRAGASGFLLKSSAASELFEAIRAVQRGGTYVTPSVAGGVMSALQHPERRSAGAALTVRQREILQLLTEGLTMKEVAATLGITPRTVAFHKYRMMKQLGIETSAKLIQFAVKSGIASD